MQPAGRLASDNLLFLRGRLINQFEPRDVMQFAPATHFRPAIVSLQ